KSYLNENGARAQTRTRFLSGSDFLMRAPYICVEKRGHRCRSPFQDSIVLRVVGFGKSIRGWEGRKLSGTRVRLAAAAQAHIGLSKSLVVLPEFRPRNAWWAADEDIGMILALLVLYALR